MRRTRIAVFGPAVVTLLLGGGILAGLERARESRAAVAHTHAVIETLDYLVARLVDAETGVRGFMIRGDSTFLEPYEGAAADVQAGLVRLRALTADRADEERRLDTLAALSAEKFAVLDSGVTARRTQGLRALEQASIIDANRSPTSNRGKVVMDEARRLVARIKSDERRLLSDRNASESARERFVVVLVALGSIAAASLALVINARVSGFATLQAQLARDLDQKNGTLALQGRDLERQNELLAQQSEELEQQNEALAAANEDLSQTRDRLTELTFLLSEAERAVHLGSWNWEARTKTMIWSDEMYRVHGLEPRTTPLAYEEVLEYVHADDRARVDAVVRESYATHAPFAYDYRIVRAEGTVRTLHAEGRVIVGPDGNPMRMVGSGLDVTEQRLAAAARERVIAEVVAANRAKMDFLTTMSHELRTPLTAIDGYAELLMIGIRGPVTDAQTTDLTRIRESGRYLLSLINDILSFAKVEAGKSPLNMTAVPLTRALAAVEIIVLPHARAKEIVYTQTIGDPSLSVRADEERLQQVVLNLVTNAVKFTERRGSVAVTCEADDTVVRIRVRDTGRGISADMMPLIFDAFVQGDGASGTGVARGVGLGLAISRELARQMGGDLTVESAVGVGSTFEFTLPRAAGAPQSS
jgi:signal transduction histidine kinase/CHASE3 domain sensor protein